MDQVITAATRPLSGTLAVPGDKSLSHRVVLFSAMAAGTSVLTGVLDSADVRSTIAAVEALGAGVEVLEAPDGSLALSVTGWGAFGPRVPERAIDCGNSGTTARLLLGVLAGWRGPFTLVGDGSLSRRPMGRVCDPLLEMGASCDADQGTLPLTISGGPLSPLVYDSPVASAQVKTALLLAGMRAEGRTVVREPALSRDHTERLLPAYGVQVGRDHSAGSCWVDGPVTPTASDVRVPGDPSSAAFLVSAALLVPGSGIEITGVALNPTRTGFLQVLDRMGASLRIAPGPSAGSEPVGSILVGAPGGLQGTVITPAEVPSLVDEIPILALVASQASGVTRFEGIGELRVKESDRLEAIAAGLTALGARVIAGPDSLQVEGPVALTGGNLSSLGDHRLAMTWAIAGLVATGPVRIGGFESVGVSYPCFLDDLAGIGALDPS